MAQAPEFEYPTRWHELIEKGLKESLAELSARDEALENFLQRACSVIES